MSKEDPMITYANKDGSYRMECFRGEHGVFFAYPDGYQDFESAKEIAKLYQELRQKEGKKITLCLDISKLEGSDPRNRLYMRKNLTGDDSPIDKMAIVGGKVLTRGMFNLVSKVAAIPLRLFKTKQQAIDWLVKK